MSAPKEPHPFNTDRPITSRAEDELGRNPFAKSLADAISTWKAHDSLVIGLHGQWGQGKTSVKYLVLDFLRDKSEAAPFIVDFNPWQWSGQSQIAKAFFADISVAIGSAGKVEDAAERVAKWRQYAALLSFGGKVTTGLQKALPAVAGLLALAFGGAAFASHPLAQQILIMLSVVFLALAGILGFSSGLAEDLARFFEERGRFKSASIEQVRSELKTLMAGLSQPVLVIIDDIDRLLPEEIRLVFQLVKTNADFPNMVYLLIFQRDIVEKALEQPSGGGIPISQSRDYLEKIINVGFDVPAIEKAKLKRFVSAGIDKLFEDYPLNQEAQGRLTDIYHKSLQYFLVDLRDVKRLLSSLDFYLNLLTANRTLEVNPVDLIALEVLRVFEPGVYDSLHGAKAYLTAPRGFISDDERKAAAESLIAKSSSENRREHVRILLKTIFPVMELSRTNWDDWINDWGRDLNACHANIFDRYFLLRLAEGDISQPDIERFLSLIGDRAGLVAELRSVNRQKLFSVFLDRIHVYKQTIDIRHAVSFIAAFCDVWDEIDDEDGYAFPQTSHIIYRYLFQEPDSQKRGQMLVEAMMQTTGLFLPVMQTRMELERHTGKQNTDPCLTDETSFETIKQICLEKLQAAACDGRLLSNRYLRLLLNAWQDFGAAREAADWLATQITTTPGLLAVITAFIFRSISTVSGSYTSKVNWHFDLKTLETFIPANVIEQQISTLDENILTDEQRRAVNCFRRDLQRKRNGKPYGSGRICPDGEGD